MKIIDTFVPCLYAFKYEGKTLDELERVFDEWADPMFLNDFFEKNRRDITIPIDKAIKKVNSEAIFLRDKLIKLANKSPNQLSKLFKNLDNNETFSHVLSKQKAPNRWLRLYAIKIDEDNYVITGGTIKLDSGAIASRIEYRMQDRPHTNNELIKINKCRDYLNDKGVYDNDSFKEIFF